jgi:hypothetical protein
MKSLALAALMLGVVILAAAAVFYMGGSSSSPPPLSSSSSSSIGETTVVSSSSFPSGTASATTTATITATTGSPTGPDHLQLRLSTNATHLQYGGGVEISASEYNTAATPENISAANNWPVAGLSVGACGHMAYSFGVAIFQGYYTSGNVSAGQPLQIYPVVPCPMLIRLVTGYLFAPLNDSAVILPGTEETLMSVNVATIGTFNESLTPFSPGTYTVAAGDEWGGLTVLYFSVETQGGEGGVTTTITSAILSSGNSTTIMTTMTATTTSTATALTSSSVVVSSSSSSSFASSTTTSAGVTGMGPRTGSDALQ